MKTGLIVSLLYAVVGCSGGGQTEARKSSEVTSRENSYSQSQGGQGSEQSYQGEDGDQQGDQSAQFQKNTFSQDRLKSSESSHTDNSSDDQGSQDVAVARWELELTIKHLTVTGGDDCDQSVIEKGQDITSDLGKKVDEGVGGVKDWVSDKLFLTEMSGIPDPRGLLGSVSQDLGDFVICIRAGLSGADSMEIYCPGTEQKTDNGKFSINKKKTMMLNPGEKMDLSIEVTDKDLIGGDKLINEVVSVYGPSDRNSPEAKSQTIKTVGKHEACKGTLEYKLSWSPR